MPIYTHLTSSSKLGNSVLPHFFVFCSWIRCYGLQISRRVSLPTPWMMPLTYLRTNLSTHSIICIQPYVNFSGSWATVLKSSRFRMVASSGLVHHCAVALFNTCIYPSSARSAQNIQKKLEKSSVEL